MLNVHGIQGSDGWYRKLGDCFDFVSQKEFASDLTEEECETIMATKERYCKMYDAFALIVIE